ncbi:phospholipase B1, membrane-associated-like [Argopecten irradians]|uniref:phospholipase B1, membrane-associated-like n=1 Tax=Argopecten irradians TaxID=31199 RepID=UPI00370FC1E8
MFLLFLVITVCTSVEGKAPWYQRYEKFFTEVLPNNATLTALWEEHMATYRRQTREISFSIPHFDCHITQAHSGQDATSVHMLHPGDVKIVAAMGDSLTAGNGILASNVIGDLLEYRGHSWSIGGDGSLEEVLTFPNILKKFGGYLYGFSEGIAKRNLTGANLNVANPGDVAANMPEQADLLVARMTNNPNVRISDDWKIVTLFIGGNDLCDYCSNPHQYSPENYVNHIRDALDILKAKLPKTFVNVVSIFDIAPIASMEKGIICTVVHSYVCECGQDPTNGPMLRQVTHAYQRGVEDLINSGRYDTSDDFTVVVQPFYKHTEPPKLDSTGKIDMSYFSPDCFHFNHKGHFASAISLWNNMLEAPAVKQQEWYLNQPFHCPAIQTYNPTGFFTTYKN